MYPTGYVHGYAFMKMAFDQVLGAAARGQPRVFVFYGQPILVQGVILDCALAMDHKIVPSHQLYAHKEDLETPSLFGKPGPVLTIVPQDRATAATLKLARQWPQGFCIFVGAASPPAGILAAQDVAAVPCYACSDTQARTMLTRHMQRVGLTTSDFTPKALQALIAWTRGGSWQQAVMLLGLCSDRPLDLEHLDILLPQDGDEAMDVLVNPERVGRWQLCGQDAIKTVRLWRKAFDHGLQLAFLLDKFSPKDAFAQIYPPVFFKNEPLLISMVKTHARKKLAQGFEKLALVEAKIKTEGDAAVFWLQNFLVWLWR